MTWLIFPNQLFKAFLSFGKNTHFVLIEHPIYFLGHDRHMRFSKVKLAFTKATLLAFQASLSTAGFHKVEVIPFEAFQESSLKELLLAIGISHFSIYDPNDMTLERELASLSIPFTTEKTPGFLYNREELEDYFKSISNPFFHNNFYKYFREKLNILMKGSKPTGGKFSYDLENRKPLSVKIKIPAPFLELSADDKEWWSQGANYAEKYFPNNPGDLSAVQAAVAGDMKGFFPVTYEGAERHLKYFLARGLNRFGPYQDAIQQLDPTAEYDVQINNGILFHSALAPLINCGLISPCEICNAVLAKTDAPIQSREGFIRQIMGWREYIRFVYLKRETSLRESNDLFNFHAIDDRFYNGSTGIPPVDQSIKFAIKFGYLHHIHRLMILCNFMNLCRIVPTEICRWFTEFSLDSYDWVMVPNVYGMGTYGNSSITTKPYICSSNYILKMSNYRKNDEWCKVWDGMYFKFVADNEKLFAQNNRMGLVLANYRKKTEQQKKELLDNAEIFLKTLTKL